MRRLFRRRARDQKLCFLHIGPHKTGTTAIQQSLFNDERRLAREGLYYPPVVDLVSGRRRNNHTPLTRPNNFKLGSLLQSPYWAELARQLALVDDSVVISSEHFAERMKQDEVYDQIIEFFDTRGFRVVIIAFVRDQPAWLNSWYTQDQRNFSSQRSLPEFRDHAIEAGLLDPWRFLGRAMNDPRVDVRVVAFESALRTGLARAFYDAIGVSGDFAPSESRQVNPNLGHKGLYAAQEIMRRVDMRVRSMPNYVPIYESFKILMSERGWDRQAFVGVTDEDVGVLRERYSASNDLFAHRWFNCDWAQACPPVALTPCVFDFESAAEEDRRDVIEVVERMVEFIRADPSVAKAFMEEHRALRVAARRQGLGWRALARAAGAADGSPRLPWPRRRPSP